MRCPYDLIYQIGLPLIRPKFKASYHIEVLEPDAVFLLSEHGSQLLIGRLYAQLASLLNGEYTVPLIIGMVDASPSQTVQVIKALQAAGYLTAEDDSLPTPWSAFWEALDVPSAPRLSEKTVNVEEIGGGGAQAVVDALYSLGVPQAAISDLRVVVTDDYLREELDAINQHALASRQGWMLARLVGEVLWIGPVFLPDQTACWQCMAHRIRINRPVEDYVRRQRSDLAQKPELARAAFNASIQLGANIVATEIAKWLAGSSRLHDQLITLNALTMQTQIHPVMRRPQCPACGTLQHTDRSPQSVTLMPRPKPHGRQRSLTTEQALAASSQLISPITGVITHLTDAFPQAEGLMFNYVAGHAFAKPPQDVRALQQQLAGRSGGKGQTEAQAKMSAIGEAVERYAGTFWSEGEMMCRASYRDLADDAIHPAQVTLFSETQYANRTVWNAHQKGGFHRVPEPFNESALIDWTPFWSLTHQTTRFYPAYCSYYGHPDQRLGYGGCDSNGCASESTLEEAVYQAFLELAERDSVALWWYNRIKRPAVDLDSFDIPYIEAVQRYYERHHRDLWVLDLTADLSIPTFAAISARVDREVEDIMIGFGAHLDAPTALLSAVTEMNQFWPNVYYSHADGSTRYFSNNEDTIAWYKTATRHFQPHLLPDQTIRAKTPADYRILTSSDYRQDVEICVQLAASAGLEVLMLDQSRPDIPLKVCRVIAPGMRHFWRRLGSGRLYDVPVSLGWLPEPLSEDALNPISVYF